MMENHPRKSRITLTKVEGTLISQKLNAIDVTILDTIVQNVTQSFLNTKKKGEKSNFVEKKEEETLLMTLHAWKT